MMAKEEVPEGFLKIVDLRLEDPILYHIATDQVYIWVSYRLGLYETLFARMTIDPDADCVIYCDMMYFPLSWIQRIDPNPDHVKIWTELDREIRELLEEMEITSVGKERDNEY